MKVLLNGEAREIAENLNLHALLETSPYAQRRIAIKINREIMPKSLHTERVLREGDHIKIVQTIKNG